MPPASTDVLLSVPLYTRLGKEDLEALAAVAEVRLFTKGQHLFEEGDPGDHFHTLVRGRVKIWKHQPSGKDLILAIVGPGDPAGAVAVYLGHPFPATAEALEDTVCVRIPRNSLFELIDRSPSLVRGLLLGMTLRLVELTGRLETLTGGHVEARFARLFLKLHDGIGRTEDGGVFIPLHLSRQELADMTGTTVETCIRIMSRWDKELIVITEERGFRVPKAACLRRLAED